MKHALINGVSKFVNKNVEEACQNANILLEVIKDLLLDSINIVSNLFGTIKMFLL